MDNPFKFGSVVSEFFFTDRDVEYEDRMQFTTDMYLFSKPNNNENISHRIYGQW